MVRYGVVVLSEGLSLNWCYGLANYWQHSDPARGVPNLKGGALSGAKCIDLMTRFFLDGRQANN